MSQSQPLPPAPPGDRSALVRLGNPLRFPHDHGAHPDTRTEWWYLTGSLQGRASASSPAQTYGFQITFFRSRVDVAAHSASRFATRQLIFAHAAVTDLQRGELLHDQRIARAGWGLADAAEGDTHLTLRDWQLHRTGDVQRSTYRSRIPARAFQLDLNFTQTQPVLLQGQAGFSRKGPDPQQASHYYSHPHLAVDGSLRLHGQTLNVQGSAWLDHEWSESIMHPEAVGWDWIGMNLQDGRALTAFRLRRQDGSTLWSGGSLRTPGQPARIFTFPEVRFTPGRTWLSPASGARYPVEWTVDTPAGRFQVRARLDAQELDSRGSTGSIYWEGLSELRDAQGAVVGGGYLEMTGYASALVL
ncbi:MAG: carotenoid 1,2-hydratase [Aquabacterium sp.]|nr:carotenoid 1,2-hydratase [Aquabacterium sp.]